MHRTRDPLPGEVPVTETVHGYLAADVWLWSSGEQWVAVMHTEIGTWWDGADPVDLYNRPDVWVHAIHDVPTHGSLSWLDVAGTDYERDAREDTAQFYLRLADRVDYRRVD